MTTLRLHDPTRRPPDWMSRLSATQNAVFIRDVKTHVELDLEGVPVPRNRPPVCYVFDSFEEAERFCREKVGRIEHILCEIYDRRGKLIPPIAEITHPKHAHRVPNARSARRKIAAAWLLMAITPLLFWFDYRHEGTLIVPTVVGFACFVTALRLLFWGYNELASLKRRDGSNSG